MTRLVPQRPYAHITDTDSSVTSYYYTLYVNDKGFPFIDSLQKFEIVDKGILCVSQYRSRIVYVICAVCLCLCGLLFETGFVVSACCHETSASFHCSVGLKQLLIYSFFKIYQQVWLRIFN
jgi:hypothetical protein